MSTNTVHLHRVLTAKPEKIYRAFLDPDAMAKWLPPNGFTCRVDQMDPKVGGIYKMSFTNFTTKKSVSFGGEYRELVENERLRYTDNFDDPNLVGEIQVTVDLKKVSLGTEVTIVQEGLLSWRNPGNCRLEEGITRNRSYHRTRRIVHCHSS